MKKTAPILISLLLLWCLGRSQTVERQVVYFAYNQYNLSPAAIHTLDSTLALIRGHITTKIEISGHCDSVGSTGYNQPLSLKRAMAVKNYLAANGVTDSMPVVIKAYGKTRPLNANADSLQRSLNRRVEISLYLLPLVAVKQPSVLRIAPPDTVKPTEQVLDLSTAEINSNVALDDINFYPDSHRILPQSELALKVLLNTLLRNPTLSVEIQGYICCVNNPEEDGWDDDSWNEKLSWNRAKVIYDYLVKNGVDAKRLSWKGYGGRNPRVKPERSPDDERRNRRVEIKILSK